MSHSYCAAKERPCSVPTDRAGLFYWLMSQAQLHFDAGLHSVSSLQRQSPVRFYPGGFSYVATWRLSEERIAFHGLLANQQSVSGGERDRPIQGHHRETVAGAVVRRPADRGRHRMYRPQSPAGMRAPENGPSHWNHLIKDGIVGHNPQSSRSLHQRPWWRLTGCFDDRSTTHAPLTIHARRRGLVGPVLHRRAGSDSRSTGVWRERLTAANLALELSSPIAVKPGSRFASGPDHEVIKREFRYLEPQVLLVPE
jgi:hypothetical protein